MLVFIRFTAHIATHEARLFPPQKQYDRSGWNLYRARKTWVLPLLRIKNHTLSQKAPIWRGECAC